MAKTFRLSSHAANASADATCALANGGFLRLYTGRQPADADKPVSSGHTLLGELRFGSPAYISANGGTAEARPIYSEASAKAKGTARWFREFMADGVTAVCDGSIDRSGADLNLSTVDIEEGMTISISALPYTQPRRK